MARPKKRIGQIETPERIKAAALIAFGAHGFGGANLNEIAQTVGISRPSLLYHFGSKEQLYGHVVTQSFMEVGVVLRSAMEAPGPFAQQLEGLVTSFEDYLQRKPAVACLLARELVAPDGIGSTLLVEHTLPLIDEVHAWIRDTAGSHLRPQAPIRSVLMHVFSNAVLKASAGEFSPLLWDDTSAWVLARIALLKDEK